MSKALKDLLAVIEQNDDLIDVFSFKNSSSWVKVKDSLVNYKLKDIVDVSFTGSSLISPSAVRLILLSFANYFTALFSKKKRTLFIGAGSGLFKDQNRVWDSYFPYKDCSPESVIYLLSADSPARLIEYKNYIKKHKIVIYSFLVSPFKVLFSKLLFLLRLGNSNKLDKIIKIFKNAGIPIPKSVFIKSHLTFISGYLLYYLFLRPFRIEKAYVISSYSNSDICALLKRWGVNIIEIQHGLIGNTHSGYNYAKRRAYFPIPDRFYVYNSFWKNELLKVGYYNSDEIREYGRLKYELSLDHNINLPHKYIIFSGQGCYYNEILSFFKQSDNLLKEYKVNLYYIPHPIESENDIKNLIIEIKELSNVEVIKTREYTTEKYIYNSIAHISVYSSCHFDAIHFKNKTFVFDVMENNPLEYYINSSPISFVKITEIQHLFNYL